MSAEETRAPRRPSSERGGESRARIEILKSAAAAFRRFGYHGATVERIAETLPMKKGNLYYYFRNKQEILFACHQYSLDQLLGLVGEVESSGLAPEARLRRLIVAFVHTILDELEGTALFLDLEALSPAHRRIVVARRDLFDRAMRRVLTEGIESEAFGPGDAKLLSFAILGAVNWIPRWYHKDGPSSSQTIADTFADYLIAGLKAGRPL